jgi:hypothetical protein
MDIRAGALIKSIDCGLGNTNGTLKTRGLSCTPVMRAVQVTTLDVCEREAILAYKNVKLY